MKREVTQSIALSPEEKEVIYILAFAERMKPGTLARELFYRGLYDYLQDREVHAPKMDHEIYEDLVQLIETDSSLQKARSSVVESPNQGKKSRPQVHEMDRHIIPAPELGLEIDQDTSTNSFHSEVLPKIRSK
jgi:hypothetical protein